MSIIGIAFTPSDAYGIQSFAASLGKPFFLIQITGAPVTDAGAQEVFAANLTDIPPADGLVETLKQCVKDGDTHVVAVSSMASKDAMARLAGFLDCAMVTDVISAESPSVFKRPIVAGTLIETVEASGAPIVLTFRPAGFPKQPATGSSPVENISIADGKVSLKQAAHKSGGRPDLTQATVVVSGGRPLKDAATYESVIGGFADALGGAAGATRAAVDSGIAPNELQVGQTGKIVAPDLYIAAGISGSTQHMAGIKDSKCIVAINKDPDAPIFEVADLGIVADLFEAIPAIKTLIGK
ncbi:MAG: FAD-binding protein [Chthonomonas sp.]|nr:FAD-binding protein [Chthonomonas sp.]